MTAALGGSWKARILLCLATPPGRGARTSSTCTLDPSAFSSVPPAARGRGARPVGAFERGAPRTGQGAPGSPGFLANPERRLLPSALQGLRAPRPPRGPPGSAAPGKGARLHCPPAQEEFQLPRAPLARSPRKDRGGDKGKASLWLGALCSCSEVRSSLAVAGRDPIGFSMGIEKHPFPAKLLLSLGSFFPAFQT